MKKLLALFVLIGFGFASCQKEETPEPQQTSFQKVSEKKDTSGWD